MVVYGKGGRQHSLRALPLSGVGTVLAKQPPQHRPPSCIEAESQIKILARCIKGFCGGDPFRSKRLRRNSNRSPFYWGESLNVARRFVANQAGVTHFDIRRRAMAKKAKKSSKKGAKKGGRSRKTSEGMIAGALKSVRKRVRKLGL
jgi:hypothetical protein